MTTKELEKALEKALDLDIVAETNIEKRYKLVTQGNIKIILTESELIRAILRNK